MAAAAPAQLNKAGDAATIGVIPKSSPQDQRTSDLVSTLRESTMLMLIIGMSLLYAYVMSYLHISQSAAEWIVSRREHATQIGGCGVW